MGDSTKLFVPMQRCTILSKIQFPSTSEELDRMSRFAFASAIESIMCAMICTRPNISNSISTTSYYQANPGEIHLIALQKIPKYIGRTKYMFLVYGGKEEPIVKEYVYACFQTNIYNFRSHSSLLFMLNGGEMT